MSFHTTNELGHFRFQGAYLGEIQLTPGSFVLYLDNVIILPDNSTNRDIREMRCNNLELRIADGRLLRCIEEGYKEYDADGNLMAQYEDTVVAPESYKDTFQHLCETESVIYSIEKKMRFTPLPSMVKNAPIHWKSVEPTIPKAGTAI